MFLRSLDRRLPLEFKGNLPSTSMFLWWLSSSKGAHLFIPNQGVWEERGRCSSVRDAYSLHDSREDYSQLVLSSFLSLSRRPLHTQEDIVPPSLRFTIGHVVP